MISCDEAAIICNKTQYREASFIEKLKLRFHLLVCKVCPDYVKKNTQLTVLCQKAHLKSLSEKDKLRMKEELNNKF